MSTHGRRLKVLREIRRGRGGSPWVWAAAELARERKAMLALAQFAVDLAGLPLPPPPPIAPDAVAATPAPRVPPGAPQRRKWTMDIRPGRHDVLTWEEAMQVPWNDGRASDPGAAARTIEALPQHIKDQIETWGLMIPSYAVADDATESTSVPEDNTSGRGG
jgi:hypothetical protein